jgi:hypothetical protein
MLVILVTQKAETRRFVVQSQSWTNCSRDRILKKNPSQERAGGVAQGVDPEFKTQYQNTQIYNNNVNKNFGLLNKILNLHVGILDPGDQMVRKRPAGSVRDMDPDLTHVSSSITVTFLFGLEH